MEIVLFYLERSAAAESPEYRTKAAQLMEIVSKDPNFISIKDFTAADGESVSIIKFKTEEAREKWRNNPVHKAAMEMGRRSFYRSYQLEVCTVTRRYAFPATAGGTRYSQELLK